MGLAAASVPEQVAVKMPWHLAMFLVVIFAFAYPFDPSQSGGRLDVGLEGVVQQLETGSAQRQVALLALGMLAAVIFLSRKRSQLRVNGLLGWSMLLFLGLAAASPAWAEDPPLTLRRVGVLVLLFLGALATVTRLSQIRLAGLAVCTCGITLIISLLVELVSGTFNPFDENWRFSGVLHPVAQGWNCGLLAIASLALAMACPRSRKLFLLLSLAALVFLGLTRSRMPLASTILAGAAYGSLVSLKLRKLTFVVAYFFLVCAGLFWFVLLVAQEDLIGTAKSFAAMGRGEEATATLGSFTGRLALWGEQLDYARARPTLGYGYNAFLNPRNLSSVSKVAGWVATSPHSGYIGTLLGLGYVGATTFVLVLLLALKRSFNLSRGSPNAAFAAAVMVWLCCNLFLESSIITDPTFPTFICLAVIASLAFGHSPYVDRFEHLSRAH